MHETKRIKYAIKAMIENLLFLYVIFPDDILPEKIKENAGLYVLIIPPDESVIAEAKGIKVDMNKNKIVNILKEIILNLSLNFCMLKPLY